MTENGREIIFVFQVNLSESPETQSSYLLQPTVGPPKMIQPSPDAPFFLGETRSDPGPA